MSTQSTRFSEPLRMQGNIFRKTHTHTGRRIVVTPENSSMQYLCYARTLLDGETPEARFQTQAHETGLICLSGAVELEVGAQRFSLGPNDSAYVPHNSSVVLRTKTRADLAEFSAEVQGDYPLQIVRYSDVERNGSLHFTAGGPSATRDVNILLGKNVQAGRLVAGFTISQPGNWTSWPPHEHAKMLEEMYVYIHMPPPAFGVQFVYTDTQEPELATIVRDGDAVLMPRGYHPNVSPPGYRIGFLWAMAARREREDRHFGVVNVQPGFDQSGSGLEASKR
jgi:5-deoxy-glucuronate isomerase